MIVGGGGVKSLLSVWEPPIIYLVWKILRTLGRYVDNESIPLCRGNDTYGITGIPSTVGGHGVVRRAGLGASIKIVYQVRAARMHNTLVLLWCVFPSVLELSN